MLTKTATGYELLGRPAGDPQLGGVDLDHIVLAHVRAGVDGCWPVAGDDDPALRQALAQVRANAVDAKEALSVDTEARVAVILPDCTAEVRLTRAEFEAAVREPLWRSVEVFRQTVRDAGVAPHALHAVLLTGGSSRIPLVAQLLTTSWACRSAATPTPSSPCAWARPSRRAPTWVRRQRSHRRPGPAAAQVDAEARPATPATPAAAATQRIDVDLRTSGLTRAADTPLPPATARAGGPPVPRVTDTDAEPLVVRLGAPVAGSRPWLAPLLVVGAVLLLVAALVAYASRAAWAAPTPREGQPGPAPVSLPDRAPPTALRHAHPIMGRPSS